MAKAFKLNFAGGGEVLKQQFASQINAIAEQVAASTGTDAEVEHYTTDRSSASVRVPAEQQAKDGVLTRAASSAGLEVRAK